MRTREDGILIHIIQLSSHLFSPAPGREDAGLVVFPRQRVSGDGHRTILGRPGSHLNLRREERRGEHMKKGGGERDGRR
jgi:hypothetical protein